MKQIAFWTLSLQLALPLGLIYSQGTPIVSNSHVIDAISNKLAEIDA
jgi:hypothetical protein